MSEIAERTYQVIQALAGDWPEWVGAAAWPKVARELARLDAEWAAADETRRVGVAAQYRTTLAPYPAARARLAAALGGAALYESVLARVAALLAEAGHSGAAAELRQLSHAGAARYMKLKPVGEPTTSVKWSNLKFDFGSLSLAAAGILGAIATLSDPTTSGLAAGAAVLLILHELHKTLEREVSAVDASVFYGLVRAAGADKQTNLAAIMAKTNAARTANHLEPLTETELRRALLALERLRAVAIVAPDIWRVVEEHGEVE